MVCNQFLDLRVFTIYITYMYIKTLQGILIIIQDNIVYTI